MKQLVRLILLSSITFLFVSCNPQETLKTCTKIGCTDGLSIQLNSSLSESAIVEVTFDGMSKTISCSQGRCIAKQVFFENITPESFTVKIIDDGNTIHESSHTASYKINKPNGPDCPPDCKQAEISIVV